MAQPIEVNPGNKGQAKAQESAVTLSQAQFQQLLDLAKGNPGVTQSAPQAAQVVHIRTDGGPDPIQFKPYTPDMTKALRETVTYVIHQSFHLLWPIPGVWNTPTNGPIMFAKHGTHLIDGSLLTECFFHTTDPVYVECVESHPNYGMLISKKGKTNISEGGLRVRAQQRWSDNLKHKNMTELRNMAASINNEMKDVVIPLSDDANTLRAEITYHMVEREIGEKAPAKTANEYRQELVK